MHKRSITQWKSPTQTTRAFTCQILPYREKKKRPSDAMAVCDFKYLKEHRKVLYINLLTSGELTRHLNEIDRQAREMLELLVKQMAQAQGITGQLKSEDQMAWVGAMNNIRSAAEEVVMQEIMFE